jgi:hypothetical protein
MLQSGKIINSENVTVMLKLSESKKSKNFQRCYSDREYPATDYTDDTDDDSGQ